MRARFLPSRLELMVPVEVGGFHLGTMWFKNICVFNTTITLGILRYSHKKAEINDASRSVSPLVRFLAVKALNGPPSARSLPTQSAL